MNLIDANRTATFETETLEQWKKKAEELVAVFDKAFKGGLLGDDELLTIVPDGPLWYLPFQALPDRDGKVLAATTKIRYLPLLSMLTAKATPAAQDTVPVLIRGAFFPSEESELELLSLEDYQDALPNLRTIRKLDSPAIWSIPQWDRVIVLADAPLRKEGFRQWSPLAIDRGAPGSKLMDWMKLPFGAPREIIIPGFHTPAETALRSSGDGSELFLLTCALYASGTQTALVSRWRAAAFPSSDLVREFAQELSNLSAQESWQRAIQVIWESDVDAGAEPKLKIGENAVGLKGDHPYFWAGYLLFDLDK